MNLMLYQKNYFSALMTNLSLRSERAAQGLLGLDNAHLLLISAQK